MARRDDVRSLHSANINRVLTDPLHIRKNTQKSKFLLSRAFKWEKIMFFVVPEMPSKSFVMVLKKLPDHFYEKNIKTRKSCSCERKNSPKLR